VRRSSTNSKADEYAVQGYDSAQLLAVGLAAAKGDLAKRADMIKAMAAAKIDSPRGPIRLSSSHNVVQDFYLRKVENGQNNSIAVAAKALADPGRGCKMG
jgi:branched-chain amino acid transport system substrate-binding protein